MIAGGVQRCFLDHAELTGKRYEAVIAEPGRGLERVVCCPGCAQALSARQGSAVPVIVGDMQRARRLRGQFLNPKVQITQPVRLLRPRRTDPRDRSGPGQTRAKPLEHLLRAVRRVGRVVGALVEITVGAFA